MTIKNDNGPKRDQPAQAPGAADFDLSAVGSATSEVNRGNLHEAHTAEYQAVNLVDRRQVRLPMTDADQNTVYDTDGRPVLENGTRELKQFSTEPGAAVQPDRGRSEDSLVRLSAEQRELMALVDALDLEPPNGDSANTVVVFSAGTASKLFEQDARARLATEAEQPQDVYADDGPQVMRRSRSSVMPGVRGVRYGASQLFYEGSEPDELIGG